MKKVLKIFFRVLLVLVLLAVLAVTLCRLVLILSTRDRIRTVEEAAAEAAAEGPYDAIIVLGASVNADRKPSQMLKNRLDLALELYHAGVSKKILVTGDHRPGEYDEVDIMWEYLVVANVPEEKIVRDYQGFSTFESMSRMSRDFGVGRAIVVTQEYHLYRAMFIGQSYGVDVRGAAAGNVGDFYGKAMRTAREWAASVKDFVYSAVRKEIPQ